MAITAYEVEDDSPYVAAPFSGDEIFVITHGDNRLARISDWARDNCRNTYELRRAGNDHHLWFFDVRDRKIFRETWMADIC